MFVVLKIIQVKKLQVKVHWKKKHLKTHEILNMGAKTNKFRQ